MTMTYQEAIDYLYKCHPSFQRIGAGAYKPGLERVEALARQFDNPHKNLKTIHIAGTNGKGTTAHTIAAVLQSAGYRTGLYTSPHLFDFRERIRIDGQMISQQRVCQFVEHYLAAKKPGDTPSFFELTTMMAFDHFVKERVDVAVIETGLGGRLDSTNIITPLLSIITNISPDHTALLGHTPAEIAFEKAGIIKPGIPVVIGEAPLPEVRQTFVAKARSQQASIFWADTNLAHTHSQDSIIYPHTPFGPITSELTGDYQPRNMATILAALQILKPVFPRITAAAVAHGVRNVCQLTHLLGRWTILRKHPELIIDTGHNIGGWNYIAAQLERTPGHKHLITGFVADKDVSAILSLISSLTHTTVYFTRPSVERGMDELHLQALAKEMGIDGNRYANVSLALKAALATASETDTILVAGSNFLISDIPREYLD